MTDPTGYGRIIRGTNGVERIVEEKDASNTERQVSEINTGIYLFEPEIIDHIPSGEEFDIGGQLLPGLIESKIPFGAIELPFHWVDIGRMSDYWEANQQLMRGTLRGIDMPGKEVMPQIWTGLNVNIDWENVLIEGPVYIGSNSRIEAGCEIQGPSWISHGCHLQGGARVHRSMLFEHTLMRSHGAVFEAVVFGRYCVDKDGQPVKGHESGLDWVGDARDRKLKQIAGC